ncbi:hypothetical protein Hanom_Chr03g00251131 [Helianthus anomalus]
MIYLKRYCCFFDPGYTIAFVSNSQFLGHMSGWDCFVICGIYVDGAKFLREEAGMCLSIVGCWCMRLSTSSCIESCTRYVRSGHVVRENRRF